MVTKEVKAVNKVMTRIVVVAERRMATRSKVSDIKRDMWDYRDQIRGARYMAEALIPSYYALDLERDYMACLKKVANYYIKEVR